MIPDSTAPASSPESGERVRRGFRVRGVVQGVGFRPAVYRLAMREGLAGFVRNDAEGVWIEIEGTGERAAQFLHVLREEAPPLSRIEAIEVSELAATGDGAFTIESSSREPGAGAPAIPVDTATCDACLAEMFDPRDRRYRYPFINCTDCGPRYTIARSVPWDREQTTMAVFPLCEACRAEYDDPASRRLHAEPIACGVCGPGVWFVAAGATDATVILSGGAGGGSEAKDLKMRRPSPQRDNFVTWSTVRRILRSFAVLRRSRLPAAPAASAAQDDVNGRAAGDSAIAAAVAALRAGSIVAIRGIGGFHLAVDARNEGAVLRLRERKRRPDRPFAVMARDLAIVDEIAVVDDAAREALTSAARPIVLLPLRDAESFRALAPRLREIGVMLPYAPLHHLLLESIPLLVMTSGNRTSDPIAIDDERARAQLAGIADAFLTHDRPIASRADDSVVRIVAGAPQPVRRARGFVPEAIALGRRAADVIAVGAEMKNTVCVVRDGVAWLSPHIGDLGSLATFDAFEETIRELSRLVGAEPVVVAHDLHPDYGSTRWALASGLRRIGVQHHHAHVASCLAEHGRTGPAIGVAFDGTGCGPAGDLWGGEFLIADLDGFTRAGHLAPIALAGGEAAIRQPWRVALAALIGAGEDADLMERIPNNQRSVIEQMVRQGTSTMATTSAGRWFDAIAALCGVRDAITYDAQAAMELEAIATRGAAPLPFSIKESADEPFVVVLNEMVRTIAREVRAGAAVGEIASRFHETMAAIVAAGVEAACRSWQKRSGERLPVALSGGCFQNRILTERSKELLEERGFEVLIHRRVPPNDGGVALGQAAVAASRLERES